MFSNFELYRDGWIDAETKRKHTRSWKGCLPCRKRKKKCSEERPVCARCARSTGSQCHYPSPGNTPTASPSPTSSNATTRERPDQSPSLIQRTSSNSEQRDKALSNNTSNSIISWTPGFIPWSVDDIPPCSLTDLFFVFSPPAHALDIGPESSIISLTIPLLAQSPAIFHSMVSCSSIFLSQKQPAWQQVAIRHHCEALRSLALEMSNGSLSEPAVVVSSMAVILMLHLFQGFDASSKTPSCAHLLAAQDIFFKVFSKIHPETTLGALVLEAFVYRLAINSPFHPELLKAYTSLETLTTLFMGSPAMEGPEIASFRRSLWLGLPPDVYGSLYKASFLLRNMPLDRGLLKEAQILSEHLEALRLAEVLDGGPDEKAFLTGVDALAAQARRLYIAAAELLSLKVIYRDIQAADDRVQRLLRQAMLDILSFNTITQHLTPLLICPLAILGTAAIRAQDREILVSRLNRMRNLTGGRELDSVLCFLQDLWGQVTETFEGDAGKSGTTPAQLDIWLDHSRLRCVTL